MQPTESGEAAMSAVTNGGILIEVDTESIVPQTVSVTIN